jgi:hypothetical protein
MSGRAVGVLAMERDLEESGTDVAKGEVSMIEESRSTVPSGSVGPGEDVIRKSEV